MIDWKINYKLSKIFYDDRDLSQNRDGKKNISNVRIPTFEVHISQEEIMY